MLSEISQTENDKYCMISLICGILKILKIKSITSSLITENKRDCQRLGVKGVEKMKGLKWVKTVKRDKPPTIKDVSHGDVMYSKVTIVNNILLHT